MPMMGFAALYPSYTIIARNFRLQSESQTISAMHARWPATMAAR
jgi:hypothetical protein